MRVGNGFSIVFFSLPVFSAALQTSNRICALFGQAVKAPNPREKCPLTNRKARAGKESGESTLLFLPAMPIWTLGKNTLQYRDSESRAERPHLLCCISNRVKHSSHQNIHAIAINPGVGSENR